MSPCVYRFLSIANERRDQLLLSQSSLSALPRLIPRGEGAQDPVAPVRPSHLQQEERVLKWDYLPPGFCRTPLPKAEHRL